jgi:hypothetical protein
MSSSEGLRVGHEAASLAGRAKVLADRILAEDAADRISDEALQSLMTAAVKLYVARLEAGPGLPPFAEGDVTATEVAVAATGMLKAVEMEVFELGMWQVWGNS